MSELRTIVAGAGGRMGAANIRAVAAHAGLKLVGAVDRPGAASIGKDAGTLAGIDALGESSYTAVQIASSLGSAGMKLVPDVVLGDGRSNLTDVLLAKMATHKAEVPAVIVNGTGTNGLSRS